MGGGKFSKSGTITFDRRKLLRGLWPYLVRLVQSLWQSQILVLAQVCLAALILLRSRDEPWPQKIVLNLSSAGILMLLNSSLVL